MRTRFWWWKPARSSSRAGTTTCCAAAAATLRSSGCSSATRRHWRRSARRRNCFERALRHQYAGSLECRRDNQADDQDADAVFQRVIDRPVPFLDLAAAEMQLIELAEHLVEHADMFAFDVLGGGGLDDVMADPAVDRGHEAVFHRTLD